METCSVISDSDVSVIPDTPSATEGPLYKSKMIIMAISTLAEHLDLPSTICAFHQFILTMSI